MADRRGTGGTKRSLARILLQGAMRSGLRALWRLLVSLEIEGLERLPTSGPFVAAINHLAIVDSSLIFCFLPRVTVHIVHADWKNWFTKQVYNGVFVADESDPAHPVGRALAVLAALGALRKGTGVLIAPEGSRSPTGSMQQGYPGVAYLAAFGRAPVVPVAIHGQEKLRESWRRLRRAPVCLRIGRPLDPPAAAASDDRMQLFTDRVMTELARMLPSGYRGVYSAAADGRGPV